MLPMTLLATNKVLSLLKSNDALSQAVNINSVAAGVVVTALSTSQVFSSYISPDLGDLDLQFSYPRVCVYTTQVVNNQTEKFRPFSGFALVVADVWSSASLEQQTETGLHFYVDALAGILRSNIGDLGDGYRYSGVYEVHMQSPKVGGFGFVQQASVTCRLEVSFN